jgi:predicted lipoprotein with Yx(FWY)xxD motif
VVRRAGGLWAPRGIIAAVRLFARASRPQLKEKTMNPIRNSLLVLAGVALGAYASLGLAAPAGIKVSDGVLTNATGMTLYTFDRDTPGAGKSACNGPCAANWPPIMAAADAKSEGDYTIVTRDDGAKQWAYKGKPLYLWAKDQKPGDKTGDGFNNVWHVAKP